jgi:endonuclease/exonuclease/phosphatase family metal-dependent hydrolase
MTFNLRFENERDGENSWSRRRELVTRLIEQYSPSILGTQEGMWPQLEFLKDSLPQYHLHAPHRTIDSLCQYPTLFFDKKDFTVHEAGEFWLSETPQVHLSKSWDSAFPRMMSYARASGLQTASDFWVAVTHLDHIGAEARFQQAKIIATWIKERNAPVILMGDFNDSPGSPVHGLLTSPEIGLKDSWQVFGGKEDSSSFTHHRFTGVPQKTRMDWILISSHFQVIDAEINKSHFDNCYPSDHFPYLATLEIES